MRGELTPERIVAGVPDEVSSDAVLDALATLGIDREVLEHTTEVNLEPRMLRLEVALIGSVHVRRGWPRLVVEVPVRWSGSMLSTPVNRRHVPHPVPGLEPEPGPMPTLSTATGAHTETP